MRSAALALLVAAGGCRGLLGIEEATVLPGDAPADVGDAPTDIAPDAALCFGQLLEVCFQQLPTTPLLFNTDASIDTSVATSCTRLIGTGGGTTSTESACLIAANEISISSDTTLTVRGSRPLVLLATGRFTIDGAIHFAGNPASAGSSCGVTDSPGVSGGGAGGSLGTRGGLGGGPSPGMPGPTTLLATLRGGCPGQHGAMATGGYPGGGLLLIADRISVTGSINASGAGGEGGLGVLGGGQGSGGGGGGSGGVIVLEATTSISLAGESVLIASGGGGGGGAAGSSGPPGSPGSAPSLIMPFVPAAGGPGGNTGAGKGGDGSGMAGAGSGAGSGGASATAPGSGGGGGGGGGGLIRLLAPAVTSLGAVSPPSQ